MIPRLWPISFTRCIQMILELTNMGSWGLEVFSPISGARFFTYLFHLWIVVCPPLFPLFCYFTPPFFFTCFSCFLCEPASRLTLGVAVVLVSIFFFFGVWIIRASPSPFCYLFLHKFILVQRLFKRTIWLVGPAEPLENIPNSPNLPLLLQMLHLIMCDNSAHLHDFPSLKVPKLVALELKK